MPGLVCVDLAVIVILLFSLSFLITVHLPLLADPRFVATWDRYHGSAWSFGRPRSCCIHSLMYAEPGAPSLRFLQGWAECSTSEKSGGESGINNRPGTYCCCNRLALR